MAKRLFLYDLEEALEAVIPGAGGGEEDLFFSASPRVRSCLGCFGCWIKTPGRCVIRDRCEVIPSYFAQSQEIVIISPMWYGGYSANIKAVLDRCIGYLLPYFRIVHQEMHHQLRCGSQFLLKVHFYGACDESEKEIARRLVKANAVNLGAKDYRVDFHESALELGEVWK